MTSPLRSKFSPGACTRDNTVDSEGGDVGCSPTTMEVRALPPQVTQFGTGIPGADGCQQMVRPLPEAIERQITEFDLIAYTKDDATLSMQKNIMHRMFKAFDVTQLGFLKEDKVEQMCNYLGRNLTKEEHHSMLQQIMDTEGHVTFEKFWMWWREHSTVVNRKAAFSMASADFGVHYHRQQLKIREEGEMFTPSYRVRFMFKNMETLEEREVSPWHDIPLFVHDFVRTKPESVTTERYNFICEIPKWTRAKFEISTGEAFNPIRQDMKNGLPRFYRHGDMMWNYGALPQTWESTEVKFEGGYYGDNDPIDAIEIGMTQFRVGQVGPVKVLGVLGMIDDDQMDWKVVCISHNDPIARFLKDIDDVPRFLPGCLDAMREWLRVYKICQGGVENKFVFNGEFKNRAFAIKVIEDSHLMWSNLRKIKRVEKV